MDTEADFIQESMTDTLQLSESDFMVWLKFKGYEFPDTKTKWAYDSLLEMAKKKWWKEYEWDKWDASTAYIDKIKEMNS